MNDDGFTEEELAMMEAAEGLVAESQSASERVQELEAHTRALAQMIADGTERERELRHRVHELTQG